MGANRARKLITSALATAGAFVASQAAPQDAGRPLLTFNFAQSLEFSDNPRFIVNPTGTTLSSRTGLGFSFASSTKAEELLFEGGLDLLYELATSSVDPYRDGVNNPFVNLRYGRNSATSTLDLFARYLKSDIGDLRRLTDPSGVDLIVDPGQVERTTFGFSFETGIGGPIGTTFDSEYRRRVYVDTLDPLLQDDEFFRARGTLRFSIDRATDASLVARYDRDQRLGGSDYDRRTTAFGFRLDRQFDDVRNAGIEITSDKIKTTELGVTDTVEDYSVILDYGQELPNGDLQIVASSILENVGTRNTLRFDRSLDLDDTTLSAFFGLTNNDTSDLHPIFGFTVERALPTGSVSARLSQIVQQDRTSNFEFRDRYLTLTYAQEINSFSSWDTSFSWVDSDNLTLDTDRRRINFIISYSRAITQDWDFVTGYEFRDSRSDTDADRQSNTLFVTLRRDFAARP